MNRNIIYIVLILLFVNLLVLPVSALTAQDKELETKTSTNSETKFVVNQDELYQALSNSDIHNIEFKQDIVLSNDINIKDFGKNVTINGNGFSLETNNNYAIYLNGTGNINLNNLVLFGKVAGNYSMFNSKSNINFEVTNLTTKANNSISAIITNGEVIFSGINNINYTSKTDSTKYPFIQANKLILDSAKLEAYIEKGSFSVATGGNSEFKIINSEFTLNSVSTVNNIYMEGKNSVVTFDNSTVNISNNSSDASGVENSGMFWENLDASKNVGTNFNVINNSNVNFYSKSMSAVYFRKPESIFRVDNSIFNIKTEEEKAGAAGLYPSIRYKYGKSLFEITNRAKMNIIKTQGQSAGVRMVEDGNSIVVSDGASFTGEHQEIKNMNYWNYYQTIEYGLPSGHNSFLIEGEGSSVELKASTGPAISSQGALDLSLKNKGSFIATGNSSYGTFAFHNSPMNIILDDPLMFDLKNTYSLGKNKIVDSISKGGAFVLGRADLSVWDIQDSVYDSPSKEFNNIDLQLSGKNFDTIEHSSDKDFSDFYKGKNFSSISRISSNNSKPIVDNISTPTNADNKIFIHAKVFSKPGEYRDALKGEVNIEGKIISKDGKEQTFSAQTGDVMDTYYEKEVKGYALVKLPDGTFLNKDDTIIIEKAYRGNKDRQIFADELPDPIQVISIVPPEPAKMDYKTIYPNSKFIEGQGTPGRTVSLKLNNQKMNSTAIIGADGKFKISITEKLKVGDKIQLFLNDNDGLAAVPDRPETNNELGNITASDTISYHDKKFERSPVLDVIGGLYFNSVPQKIDFGIHKLSSENLVISPDVIGELIIDDTRQIDEKSGWSLSIKSENYLLKGNTIMTYVNRENQKIEINDENQTIERNLSNNSETENISNEWKKDSHGISLNIPPASQKIGDYSGSLTWTLRNTPKAN